MGRLAKSIRYLFTGRTTKGSRPPTDEERESAERAKQYNKRIREMQREMEYQNQLLDIERQRNEMQRRALEIEEQRKELDDLKHGVDDDIGSTEDVLYGRLLDIVQATMLKPREAQQTLQQPVQEWKQETKDTTHTSDNALHLSENEITALINENQKDIRKLRKLTPEQQVFFIRTRFPNITEDSLQRALTAING
jgi:hypothetical protein